MNLAASIRPDSWDLPLFLHILGAMALVGALALAAVSLVSARRDGSLEKAQLGFRALLWAALPAWVVMYGGAQWIADKEGLNGDDDPAWLGIGHIVSEPGLLLMLIATVVAGVGLRRARRASISGAPGGVRAATVLVGVLLVFYVVAIWAMTTKPV